MRIGEERLLLENGKFIFVKIIHIYEYRGSPSALKFEREDGSHDFISINDKRLLDFFRSVVRIADNRFDALLDDA